MWKQKKFNNRKNENYDCVVYSWINIEANKKFIFTRYMKKKKSSIKDRNKTIVKLKESKSNFSEPLNNIRCLWHLCCRIHTRTALYKLIFFRLVHKHQNLCLCCYLDWYINNCHLVKFSFNFHTNYNFAKHFKGLSQYELF